MATPKQVLKSVGPKLVPFFKTVAVYFVLFIPSDQPSLLALIIKCLPILSLIAFVLLHGMSLGEEYAYSRRILFGLIFSVIGDALLVWEDFFLHGLGSFLVAQICYVSAFGFTPFNLYAATVTYALMGIGISVLMPGTEGVVSVGMPIYTFCLMTMVWRAVARVQLFEELWTWTKLCSCVGGVLFAVSDGLIGLNTFYMAVPHAQALIMVTYYAAQLGISLSVVDSKASYLDSIRYSNQPATTTTTATKATIAKTGLTKTANPTARAVSSRMALGTMGLAACTNPTAATSVMYSKTGSGKINTTARMDTESKITLRKTTNSVRNSCMESVAESETNPLSSRMELSKVSNTNSNTTTSKITLGKTELVVDPTPDTSVESTGNSSLSKITSASKTRLSKMGLTSAAKTSRTVCSGGVESSVANVGGVHVDDSNSSRDRSSSSCSNNCKGTNLTIPTTTNAINDLYIATTKTNTSSCSSCSSSSNSSSEVRNISNVSDISSAASSSSSSTSSSSSPPLLLSSIS